MAFPSPISNWAQTPATIHHAENGAARDEYGNVVPDATTTHTTVYMAQQQRTEVGPDSAEGQRFAATFFDTAVALDADDWVEVGGLDYQVIGEPWRVVHPLTGAVDHVEVTLGIVR